MPPPDTGREPDLLTITEAAELVRAPSPPCVTGGTWAPGRAASAVAAASSTAPTTSATGSTPSTTARAPPAGVSGGEPAPPLAHSPGCGRHCPPGQCTPLRPAWALLEHLGRSPGHPRGRWPLNMGRTTHGGAMPQASTNGHVPLGDSGQL